MGAPPETCPQRAAAPDWGLWRANSLGPVSLGLLAEIARNPGQIRARRADVLLRSVLWRNSSHLALRDRPETDEFGQPAGPVAREIPSSGLARNAILLGLGPETR